MNDLFTLVENSLSQTFGSMVIVGLAIIFLFFIVLVIAGVDFRFSLIIIAPLLLAMASSGWFPAYIGGLVWVVVIGFGLFIAWNRFREGSY